MNDIKEFLTVNGFYLNIIVGNSMRPILRDRKDCVLILPLKNKNVIKYDVILFSTPHGLILHRVIKVLDNGYITRGDNSHRVEFVTNANILGIMKGYYRDNRYTETTSFLYKLYSRLMVFFNFIIRWRDGICGFKKR